MSAASGLDNFESNDGATGHANASAHVQGPTVKIQRRVDSAPIPLSFAQERLWFLEQFQPGNLAYNVVARVPFAGPVNVGSLEYALHRLVQRHEILRTAFQAEHGTPFQVVLPDALIKLEIIDLHEFSLEEAEAKAIDREEINAANS